MKRVFLSFAVMFCFAATSFGDVGTFFAQESAKYFAAHGATLPDESETVSLSDWSPPQAVSVSNIACQVRLPDGATIPTNVTPDAVSILASSGSQIGFAKITRFGTARDAWLGFTWEMVAGSMYGIHYDKYASTNLTTHCSVFFPLVRHDDEILGTDPRSATILIRNLRIDVSSDASLAREIALALADDVKEQDIFEE